MLAVHEEKLTSQEEAIINSQSLVETRRAEFSNEIKEIHDRITSNNKQLTQLMSEQHLEQKRP